MGKTIILMNLLLIQSGYYQFERHYGRNNGNGVPCMTLRDNTERPETITIGTNELIGTDPRAIKPAMEKLFSGDWKKGNIPELWDGKTAERIIKHLISL